MQEASDYGLGADMDPAPAGAAPRQIGQDVLLVTRPASKEQQGQQAEVVTKRESTAAVLSWTLYLLAQHPD